MKKSEELKSQIKELQTKLDEAILEEYMNFLNKNISIRELEKAITSFSKSLELNAGIIFKNEINPSMEFLQNNFPEDDSAENTNKIPAEELNFYELYKQGKKIKFRAFDGPLAFKKLTLDDDVYQPIIATDNRDKETRHNLNGKFYEDGSYSDYDMMLDESKDEVKKDDLPF